MSKTIHEELSSFRNKHHFFGKGPLSVAVQVTRLARELGLPLEPDNLLTPRGGQVQKLSGERIKQILHEYGEDRLLSKEGGRTSRGSMQHMRDYVDFLNRVQVNADLDNTDLDLAAVELWWVEQVQEHLSSKPLRLNTPSGESFESIVSNVLEQAEKRQQERVGETFVGTVLQHLIGAKLEMILGNEKLRLTHHSASVSDSSSVSSGDFQLDGIVIHVTTAPSEALIRKCESNIQTGLRPIIVTRFARLNGLQLQISDLGLHGKIEVFPAEQFLASNLYEWGGFDTAKALSSLHTLVKLYNQIVETVETDQSLRIE